MYTIYGADWCTFCKQAVEFCNERDLPFTYIDIDYCEDPRVALFRSLPQIFDSEDRLIGGFTELVKKINQSA